MAHFTITPANSIYLPGTALTLRTGNDLTVLSGGYLAGDVTGLALMGDNAVMIRGEVSGDTAVTFAGAATIAVASGGAILGGARALSGAGELTLTNWGEVLTASDASLPVITVTGGHVVKIDNFGLIASTQPMTQGGQAHGLDIVSERFFLTNTGTLAGDAVAETSLYSLIDNTGTMGSLILTVAGETRITNTGTLGGVNLEGSGNVTLTGEEAEFGWTQLALQGGTVDLHDLQGSHFAGLWVSTQGGGTLDLAGAVVDDLNIWGHVSVYLAGAEVGYIIANGARIDASGLTTNTGTIELGPGSEQLTGSALDDCVIDWGGSDWISLGAGDDILCQMMWDETGNQTLDGADTIDGGAGWDIYSADPFCWAMRIDLNAHEVGARKVGSPVGEIWNVEEVRGSNFNDILRGDGRANGLYGGDGDDVLSGGGGADTLAGGGGENWLRGGAGADVLVFFIPSRDQILDFQTGRDVIDLSGIDLDRSTTAHEGLSWGTGPGMAQLETSGGLGHLQAWGRNGEVLFDVEIHGSVTREDFLL